MTVSRNYLEFFAGIGLMRMGLDAAGWNIAYANDISESKQHMYCHHFADGKTHFHLGDVHRLDANSVPSATLATASFPCTDLSLAGGRSGLSGKESSAFWGFIRVLKEMNDRRPPIILLENVVGFLTSNHGNDFAAALKALNDLGYAVDPFIIDASHFVPQSRTRLFVVGFNQTVSPFEVRETESFYGSQVRPEALSNFIFEHPEITWRIQDLPSLPNCAVKLDAILESLPDDAPEWWSELRTNYLFSQMSERHASTLAEWTKCQRLSYGTVFRRVRNNLTMAELRSDGIAGCLRTPKGGSARQIVVCAGFGNARARLMTPRECARLMGADNYRIDVPLNQALFGFGDAVCVPAVKWIAENYLNRLFDELCHSSFLPESATGT